MYSKYNYLPIVLFGLFVGVFFSFFIPSAFAVPTEEEVETQDPATTVVADEETKESEVPAVQEDVAPTGEEGGDPEPAEPTEEDAEEATQESEVPTTPAQEDTTQTEEVEEKTQEPAAPTIDIRISSIEISEGVLSPEFNPDTDTYTIEIETADISTSSVTITPAISEGVSIAIAGTATDSTPLTISDNTISGLQLGTNTITITTTDLSTTKIYTFSVVVTEEVVVVETPEPTATEVVVVVEEETPKVAYATAAAPDFDYADAGIVAVNHFLEINSETTNITIVASDYFGRAVENLGDLDGAGTGGVVTIAVGATGDGVGGAVHIVNLNTAGEVLGTPAKIVNGSGGITLAANDGFGSSIANLGDLDIRLTDETEMANSLVTIAVGAWRDNAGGLSRGAVYLINLNSAGGVVGNPVKIAHSPTGITLGSNGSFGASIENLGDLDGSGTGGVTTIAVGAYADSILGNSKGAVYIINLDADGTVRGTPVKIDGDTTDINLENGDGLGSSIESLGDLDGAGVGGVVTIAVGAVGDVGGAVYLINLNADGTALATLSKISNATYGITIDSLDFFGQSIANLGDIDGSGAGVTTIAVGAEGGEKVYTINLNSAGAMVGIAGVINSAALSATLDDGDDFGSSIASLGDINGDGIDEIVVGEAKEDTGVDGGGEIHIISFAKKQYSISTTDSADITLPAAETGEPAPTYTATLPAGLSFDGPTRRITGTPTEISVSTEYTLTATNASGTDTFAFNIEVSGPEAPEFGYADAGPIAVNHFLEVNSSSRNVTLDNGDLLGSSVVSLGDLDGAGAGVITIAVGTSGDDTGSVNNGGAVHIINLNAAGEVLGTPAKIAHGSTGITLAANDSFGFSIANLGDLDIKLSATTDETNSLVTIAVGATGDETGSTTNRGAIYLINIDSAGGIVGTPVKIDNDNTKITLANNNYFGASVADLGDIDGSGAGVTTIAVGATGDGTGGVNRGAVHIINLDSDGGVLGTSAAKLTGNSGITLSNSDSFGRSVANIGDLDGTGDGVVTLAVGATGDDAGGGDRGAIHIININATGGVEGTPVEISSSKITTLSNNDIFGSSIANLGDLDVDGAGVTTIAVGATGGEEVHIINLNSAAGIVGAVGVIGNNKLSETIANAKDFGSSITRLGDLDGDGIDEIVIGERKEDTGGTDRGAVHIISFAKKQYSILTTNSADITLPAVEIGTPAPTYALAPTTLPAGLEFTKATRRITGTVTACSAPTPYTLTATNASGDDTFSFNLVAVTDNNAPTDITLTGASVAENVTAVGTLSTTDADVGDTHTYSLVTGSGSEDNDKFTLDADTGVIAFSTAPDFENPIDIAGTDNDNTYSIRVQTDDGNCSMYSKSFEITVTDVAETDADLTGLVITGVTISNFDPATTTYSVDAINSVESVRVTPTLSHSEATVTVGGDAATSGTQTSAIDISIGSNTILVEVTAEDGTTTKIYTINIERSATAISTFDYIGNGSIAATHFNAVNNDSPNLSLESDGQFGKTVEYLGDLDGDGPGAITIAVGAQLSHSGGHRRGSIYIITLDSAGEVLSNVKINNTNTSAISSANNSWFGGAITNLGDLDIGLSSETEMANSLVTIAVTSTGRYFGNQNIGEIYLINLDSASEVVGTPVAINGQDNSFTVDHVSAFGESISSLGDLDGNGEGVVTIAVGANLAASNDGTVHEVGEVHIININTSGEVVGTPVILDDIVTRNVSKLPHHFGISVANLGDLDIGLSSETDKANSVVTIVVGADNDNTGGQDRGSIYLINLDTTGNAVGVPVRIDDNNPKTTLRNRDRFGVSATNLGDLDGIGEGVTTIAVGSSNTVVYAPSVSIININAAGEIVGEVDKINESNLNAGIIPAHIFARGLSSIGDINGDGIDDLAIGSASSGDSRGEVHIVSFVKQKYSFTSSNVVGITLPLAEGGIPDPTYSLSPALPIGLTFDSIARTITGTPTSSLPATNYTLSATNTEGVDTFEFSIEVIGKSGGGSGGVHSSRTKRSPIKLSSFFQETPILSEKEKLIQDVKRQIEEIQRRIEEILAERELPAKAVSPPTPSVNREDLRQQILEQIEEVQKRIDEILANSA